MEDKYCIIRFISKGLSEWVADASTFEIALKICEGRREDLKVGETFEIVERATGYPVRQIRPL
jgi:hypothetical protein